MFRSQHRACNAIMRNNRWRNSGKQKRLVTNVLRAMFYTINKYRAGESATMTATEKDRLFPLRFQERRQGKSDWGFACTSGNEIADTD
jgi:hypothetical protein